MEDDKFIHLICAIGLGNAIEWFDFAIFGGFADIIGFHFFPAHDEGTALMESFSIFASAFFMRPLGGILMGYIGDKYGRKRALELSVGMMVLPSCLIGFLPTYEQWGSASTTCLILLRLMQGLAVGGEMVGAYVFTVEATGGVRRGFWGGICKGSAVCGTALGMGFVAILREHLSYDALYSWGWRLPFWSSFILGVLAFVMRRFIHESAEFENAKAQSQAHPDTTSSQYTIVKVFDKYSPEVLLVLLASACWYTSYYVIFVWMVYYTSGLIEGDSIDAAWTINFLMIIMLIFFLPLGGMLGDLFHKYENNNDIGYSKVMMLGSLWVALLAGPAFVIINLKTVATIVLGIAILGIGVGIIGGNLPVYIVTKFDPDVRYTGVGIAYNLAGAFFGGTAPIAQTALILQIRKFDKYDKPYIHLFAGLYLFVVCSIAAAAMRWGPDMIQSYRENYGKGSKYTLSCIDDSTTSSSHAVTNSTIQDYSQGSADSTINPIQSTDQGQASKTKVTTFEISTKRESDSV